MTDVTGTLTSPVTSSAQTRWSPMKVLHLLANRPKALFVAIVVNLLVCAAAYHVIEGNDPVTALWVTIVTGTTTGFGDVFPKTFPGRVVVGYLMCSMWVLDCLASAQFVARLIADPDCFTHTEQEELLSDADDARAAAERVEVAVARMETVLAEIKAAVAGTPPPAPQDN